MKDEVIEDVERTTRNLAVIAIVLSIAGSLLIVWSMCQQKPTPTLNPEIVRSQEEIRRRYPSEYHQSGMLQFRGDDGAMISVFEVVDFRSGTRIVIVQNHGKTFVLGGARPNEIEEEIKK